MATRTQPMDITAVAVSFASALACRKVKAAAVRDQTGNCVVSGDANRSAVGRPPCGCAIGRGAVVVFCTFVHILPLSPQPPSAASGLRSLASRLGMLFAVRSAWTVSFDNSPTLAVRPSLRRFGTLRQEPNHEKQVCGHSRTVPELRLFHLGGHAQAEQWRGDIRSLYG